MVRVWRWSRQNYFSFEFSRMPGLVVVPPTMGELDCVASLFVEIRYCFELLPRVAAVCIAKVFSSAR